MSISIPSPPPSLEISVCRWKSPRTIRSSAPSAVVRAARAAATAAASRFAASVTGAGAASATGSNAGTGGAFPTAPSTERVSSLLTGSGQRGLRSTGRTSSPLARTSRTNQSGSFAAEAMRPSLAATTHRSPEARGTSTGRLSSVLSVAGQMVSSDHWAPS